VSDPQIPTSVLRTRTWPGAGVGIAAVSSRTSSFGSATARRNYPVGGIGAGWVLVVAVIEASFKGGIGGR
jgi:hypothetical protein